MVTLNPAQITQNVRLVGFPDKLVDTIVAIGLAESGGDTNAISHTGDYGLFQINKAVWQSAFDGAGTFIGGPAGVGTYVHWNMWRNPTVNAAMARHVYEKQGLTAWSAYDNGSYKKHLGKSSSNVIGGVVEDVTGIPVGETLDASGASLAQVAGSLRRLIAGITDAGFWIRVGLAIAGIVLLVSGISFIAADIGLSSPKITKLLPG